MDQLQNRFRQFGTQEHGGGTMFAIYIFVTFAVLVGIMLDATNAWLNRTQLTSTADIGAHAGAVAIAEGKTEDEVKAAVTNAVENNLPRGLFGQVVDSTTDVFLVHYDPYSGAVDGTTNPNSVAVRTQRSTDRKNAIPTYLLKFAGVSSFQTDGISLAVFDVNANCNATDGIYAKEKVTLTTQTRVGSGFCVHSEDYVWLPQQNTFEAGSYVSMPNLALCEDKCSPSANPGIVAVESHVIMPDIRQMVLDAYDDFNETAPNANATKQEFFATRSAGNQQVLIDNGIISVGTLLPKGSVVNLTPDEFHMLPYLPSGLVYNVACSAGGAGKKTWLNFSDTVGQMEDVALITNCGLNFQDGSRLIGSVVVTIRELSTATVTAGSSVTVADPDLACAPGERTHVMALSDVKVPAEFVMSNLTLVVDGNVDIASATSASATSKGVSIHATGRVHVSSMHGFEVCGDPDSFLTPVGKIIRLVDTNSVNTVVSTGY